MFAVIIYICVYIFCIRVARAPLPCPPLPSLGTYLTSCFRNDMAFIIQVFTILNHF